MQLASVGSLVPLTLLIAASVNWNLITVPFLLAFLFIQYKSLWAGITPKYRTMLLVVLLVYSLLTLFIETSITILWSVKGESWSWNSNWFINLFGLQRFNPWLSLPDILLILGSHLLVSVTATCAIKISPGHSNILDFSWGSVQFRAIIRSILLPGVQLVAAVARPCWISFPFFICSCVGLFHWSITGNFVGLSWGWSRLLFLTGSEIVLLYVYQMPFVFPERVLKVASYLGLYQVSGQFGWLELIQTVALLALYILLSVSIFDVEETDEYIFCCKDVLPQTYSGPMLALSRRRKEECPLVERLLPSPETMSIANSKLKSSWTKTLPNSRILQLISINFFIYGFPVCLLILCLWSFQYASISAFIILVYVGFILYSFPSILMLWRLNTALLLFILFWSICTYTFNAVFTVLHDELEKDTCIWNTIGVWHYPVPGLFVLAQFVLGVLLGTSMYLSNAALRNMHLSVPCNEATDVFEEEAQDRKIFILAVLAWFIHRSSHAISLLLLFLAGVRHGVIGFIYTLLFLIYFLRPQLAGRMRRSVIIICELHLGILYLLQLDFFSTIIAGWSTHFQSVLSILGLLDEAKVWDFLVITALLIFSAFQLHGFSLLLSLATVVERSQLPPFGFEVLKSSIGGPVLMSVCTSNSLDYFYHESNLTVKWSMEKLSCLGKAIQNAYQSFGTLIAAVTVLLVVYKLGANYISFGYFILLILWMTGRQLIGKTRNLLWAPLFVYTLIIFLIEYVITCFPQLQNLIGETISLYPDIGFAPGASFSNHLWHSLLILIVMQLFRYARAKRYEDVGSEMNGDQMDANSGLVGLAKRFVILHSDKFIALSVFYASISPISAIGFLYLLALAVSITIVPKMSSVPVKFFSIYTGMVILAEFLYQLLGAKLQLLPGQPHGSYAYWMGFRVFENNFWGLESGFRGRVLVLSSCFLQYNAFCWLKKLPGYLRNDREFDEPCCLFLPYAQASEVVHGISETRSILNELDSARLPQVQSEPSFLPDIMKSEGLKRTQSLHGKGSVYVGAKDLQENMETVEKWKGKATPVLRSPTIKHTRQWSKKAMLVLRKERYQAQIRTLRVYAKHLAENFFSIFGVEICMLVFLFASFAVLNVISLVYMAVVGLCSLLGRQTLKSLWPYFVTMFASILLIEYIFSGRVPPPWNVPEFVEERQTCCHTCWSSFENNLDYCSKCWLGIVIDDWQTLISYFMVFFTSCLKLKSDMHSRMDVIPSLNEVIFDDNDRLAWKEINYETRGQWTWLDRLRFFVYRHFLDIVLLLVLITGTFRYDVLHLGYLAFALVFFRMRVKILRRRNQIFRYLRLYNFSLIILSLLYQAPYFGSSISEGNSIYDMIGFVKIPYGFDITSQSILIDISIFCVGLLQSSFFCSKEFDEVVRYLDAEEIDAKLQAQESKAAWKTDQLQHIRTLEDMKQKRRWQVEKMKTEMFNVKLDVDVLGSVMQPESALKERNCQSKMDVDVSYPEIREGTGLQGNDTHKDPKNLVDDPSCRRRNKINVIHSHAAVENEALAGIDAGMPSNIDGSFQLKQIVPNEIPEILEEDSSLNVQNPRSTLKEGSFKIAPIQSSAQIIGHGVAQVQSLGNKALENLAGFLHIQQSESDDTEGSSVEEEMEQITAEADMKEASCISSENEEKETFIDKKEAFKEMLYRLSVLYFFFYSKIRSNVDTVCCFFFFIVYIWDFSLLMLMYPASLFLYALLVNPAPSQKFWLSMLIYTEGNILIQYMNQVVIHHSEYTATSPWLRLWLERLGIPTRLMSDSFVRSLTPLFLVYLSTLVQSSIKARDGEWMSVFYQRDKVSTNGSFGDFPLSCLSAFKENVTILIRTFYRYCLALVYGSEAPPHFVQVTMQVTKWPEDGIQPGRIESEFNRLLNATHYSFCEAQVNEHSHNASSVRVESIESSHQEEDAVIAVLEVIHVASRRECPGSQQWTSVTPAKDVAWEIQKAKDEGLVEVTSFPFPILSVIAGGKREVDLYAYIFGCDLVAFFFVAIGYQSFIKNSPEFLNVYQLEDQFPKDFVFALMTLFFLIIVDRVIYLWSFAIGKVLYYICNLGLYGYYATYYDWKMSTKEHGLMLLRIFCLIKGLSLSLQALQIKYGLPQKTALYEQFLTRKVSHMNYVGFRIYRSLPFLFEIRCILDWSCSTTSLTMYDWLKLEDIYASLYLVKCDAKLSRQKHRPGERRGIWPKFFTGICTFLLLIFIIWTPMLMYSSGNPTNYANPIVDVHVRIDLNSGSGKFTLYKTSLCRIFPLEELVTSGIRLDPHLQDYELRDVQLICCEADADNLWLVPPPTLKKLTNLIKEESSIIARWEFTRQRPKTKEVALFINQTSGFYLEQDSNETATALHIPALHPQYFRVTSAGDVRMLEGTMEMVSGNLTLNEGSQSWWTFLRDNFSTSEGCGNLDGPFAITVSEETPQGLIGDTLSKFSIASLYITFVLAVGRFIRLQCADLRMRVPFENFPSCDRLIALCEDIYAARAAGELILEEGLFWTLIRIYRSPNALLEYTKLD